jgi:hypothetical protein
LSHYWLQKQRAWNFNLIILLNLVDLNIFFFVVILVQHLIKLFNCLSKKLRYIDSSKNVRVVPDFPGVLLDLPGILLSKKQDVVSFYKEFIFRIMSGKIVITFAHPIIQNIQIWFQTGEKTFLQCIYFIVALILKIVR